MPGHIPMCWLTCDTAQFPLYSFTSKAPKTNVHAPFALGQASPSRFIKAPAAKRARSVHVPRATERVGQVLEEDVNQHEASCGHREEECLELGCTEVDQHKAKQHDSGDDSLRHRLDRRQLGGDRRDSLRTHLSDRAHGARRQPPHTRRARGRSAIKRLDEPQQLERRAALQPDIDAQPGLEELRRLCVEDRTEVGLLISDRIVPAG
eukprot:scaffold105659_cov66-Phaeocystis_antarctica.AAC.4